MKAIGIYEAHSTGPLTGPLTGHLEVFHEVELPKPSASGHDLLIKVRAVGINDAINDHHRLGGAI